VSQDRITDGLLVQGGSLDGRTFPLNGDPLSPPQMLIHNVGGGQQEMYSPRPRGDADDGPLWVYVYTGNRAAPTG
jgi:hypothetical protein